MPLPFSPFVFQRPLKFPGTTKEAAVKTTPISTYSSCLKLFQIISKGFLPLIMRVDAVMPHGIPGGPYPSHCPTLAAPSPGRTLTSFGGPCLSAASWPALLWFPSIHSDETARGVNGFVHFCRNKSGSAAGPKPGISRTC